MRRLLLAISLLAIDSLAQQKTFQNTQFDLSADLPFEDPSVLAQVEGVPTHHLKNELKPVKLQKPAEIAVPQPQQPLVPQIPQLPQPAPVAPAPAAPAAPPALPTLAPFTLPTLPPHPSLAPFTFPTHPPLPTLAPFTLPTLPPHPTIAPFTFPTPAPAPVAPGQPPVPQASDYDDTAPQKIAPSTTAAPKAQNVTPQAPRQGQQVVQQQQGQQQQQYFFSPEYVRYVQQYYPEHFRQNQQYYMSRMSTQPQVVQPQQGIPQGVPQQGVAQGVPQQGVAQGVPQQGVAQGVQQGFQGFPRGQPPAQVQRLPAIPVQVLPPPHQPIVQPPNPQAARTFAPQLVNGVQTAVGIAAVQPSGAASRSIPSAPVPKKIEQLAAPVADRSSHPPSRASNWFREEVDTKDCKKDLKKVALRFKEKFPSYLQKGGKDAALADLVEKRLIECDEKGTTGHWDKVDSLLTKVQLSKSEEHECRAGLIQEQISCQNLLNFSCQFTDSSYQFKLVPARIIIQEARQAEGGADKCRKVVRLVKKRLEG